MTFPQSATALAQLIMRLIWAYLIVLVGSLGVGFLLQTTVEPGGPAWGAFAALLVFLPLYIFPALRYTTWLKRVAAGAARTDDVQRLTTWIKVLRFCAGVGVVLSLISMLSLTLVSLNPTAENPGFTLWFGVLLIASSVVAFLLLGAAREWVTAQTARQGDLAQRSAALLPLLPGLTRWVRAVQVLTVLSTVQSLLDGGLLNPTSVVGVISLVLFLLILELSLRFARASASAGSEPSSLSPA